MSDERIIREAEAALDDITRAAPKPPSLASMTSGFVRLQREEPDGWRSKRSVAFLGAAAVVVLVVGVAAFIGSGTGFLGGDHAADEDDSSVTIEDQTVDAPTDSIRGVWVLESYEVDNRDVLVEAGVNTPHAPWIEFHQTFAGFRETFAAGDGQGTAGTFTGSTGCNRINDGFDITYEFSAGVLVLGEAVIEAGACEHATEEATEEAILAMLWGRPDGAEVVMIEVLMGGDRMTWHGRHGNIPTLTFRRDGTPPGPVPVDPPPVTTKHVVRVFDLDGLEAVTVAATTIDFVELPIRAERVEFTTMIIDSGPGPNICIGAVAQSLPPRCSGPIADGLEMGDWSDEAQGVRWGERTVVVSWPPVDGHVQLLDEAEARFQDYVFPGAELPAECAAMTSFVGSDEIHAYEQTLGDISGDVYLTSNGVLVLQVIGDPQLHREALASEGREACAIEVPRNKAEQRRIQNAVVSGLQGRSDAFAIAVNTGPGGRIEVGVAVADQETAEIVAGLVDDRTAIRIIGRGVLLP